jgi:hypothetical protein
MDITRVRAVVVLARESANAIELPPKPQSANPEGYRAWESLMLHAADRIAASVAYDAQILDAAAGPPLEVGINPPWRVLLMIAQLDARAHHRAAAKPEVSSPGRKPRLTCATG